MNVMRCRTRSESVGSSAVITFSIYNLKINALYPALLPTENLINIHFKNI